MPRIPCSICICICICICDGTSWYLVVATLQTGFNSIKTEPKASKKKTKLEFLSSFFLGFGSTLYFFSFCQQMHLAISFVLFPFSSFPDQQKSMTNLLLPLLLLLVIIEAKTRFRFRFDVNGSSL